jgi:hypothetical protein
MRHVLPLLYLGFLVACSQKALMHLPPLDPTTAEADAKAVAASGDRRFLGLRVGKDTVVPGFQNMGLELPKDPFRILADLPAEGPKSGAEDTTMAYLEAYNKAMLRIYFAEAIGEGPAPTPRPQN